MTLASKDKDVVKFGKVLVVFVFIN